jgi:serine/threonine protein kinase
MPNLLFCIGRAVANAGLGNVLSAIGDVSLISATNFIGKVAADAWKEWRGEKRQEQLNAEIAKAAQLSFDEAKSIAAQIARQVAPDEPVLITHIERFLTTVPSSIRASLRRPEDLTGTTVPSGYMLRDANDLVALLPTRFPRFTSGDMPPLLRGWRLVEQIGAGGFGEVWKAQSVRASNLVSAVKFSHGLSDTEYTLMNEGDVLNRLLEQGAHPGIVQLQDVWSEGDAIPWLRYEYIGGGDLTRLIHAWQQLSPDKKLDTVIAALGQLAGTVGDFHRLTPSVVHRDLKPSNILFDRTAKRLKIADFGIGAVSSKRILQGELAGTSTGSRMASYLRGSHTPLYASPQQRAGSPDADPRDDVHALGVIAYQMLTGRMDAAPGLDMVDDLREVGAPTALAELIGACVARKPERRPQNAHELKVRLQSLAGNSEKYQVVQTGAPQRQAVTVAPPPTGTPENAVPPTQQRVLPFVSYRSDQQRLSFVKPLHAIEALREYGQITRWISIGGVEEGRWSKRDLELLPQFVNLEKLELTQDGPFDDEFLLPIAACRGLRHLDFNLLDKRSAYRITPVGIRLLTKLVNLELLRLPTYLMLLERDSPVGKAVQYLQRTLPMCIVKNAPSV